MKADLQFQFIADMQTATLTVKREFAARRALVWDCYTKSELLDRWFAPKPLTTKTKSMDFRPGGHWHYAMIDPNGAEYWGWVDYKTIAPRENYTSTDAFSDESGAINPNLPRADWKVTFLDEGDHARVVTVVTYASPEDLQKVIDMGMKDGLASTLERLDELLVRLAS